MIGKQLDYEQNIEKIGRKERKNCWKEKNRLKKSKIHSALSVECFLVRSYIEMNQIHDRLNFGNIT